MSLSALPARLRAQWQQTLWTLLPGQCRFCNDHTQRRVDLCLTCEHDLLQLNARCYRCALPLVQEASLCGRCLRHPPLYTRTIAPLLYQGEVTELIADIKFRHRLASISLLTHLLREAINAAYSNDTLPTLVIPIPLSRRRLLTRGHDQAALLARGIGAQLGIAVDVMALQRQRHTRPQSELTDRRTRRQNVRGAFRCSLTGAPAHVALIDDVMTTGTTIDEATRVLRRQGVTRVDIWVAARTPLRRGSRWVD